MEFIFCMANERELYSVIKKLIDNNESAPSAKLSFQDIQFEVMGYQMLNILLDHVQRSQV